MLKHLKSKKSILLERKGGRINAYLPISFKFLALQIDVMIKNILAANP